MIDYVNEALFRQNSISKTWSIIGTDISLSNEDLYSESIELTESLNTEDNVIFGSCVATKLRFTTSAINTSFKGKQIFVSVILNNDVQNPFQLGTFYVDEETLSADRTKKDIVAYDAIYKIINTDVVSWYNALSFPVTLETFRNSLFAVFGISYEETTLINDNMVIEKTIDAKELSGADVLKAICEINGVFGHIDREGTFKYILLDDTPVYEITSSLYTSCEYEDYEVETIDRVQIREKEGDIGVVVGTGTNDYIVEDNFLVYGKSSSDLTPIATNLLSVINNVSFVPCLINSIGNPCVEVGDRIEFTNASGHTFETYVLSRTLKGVQALRDEITAEGDEIYPDNVNGVNYEIRQLKGKSNVLERNIEETRSTITNVERGLQTEIIQTAEGLQIQIQDLQSQIDGETAYYEREGEPTLLNYPYWDFTTSIPCNNTIRTAPIYDENMTIGGVGEEYPHFTYTEQNRKDHRSDLVYDTDSNLAYRFVQENGVWYWKEIADSEYTQILSRLSTLEATAEQLQTEYTEISATVTSQGLTITQHTSQLTQTAQQISTLVSRTDTLGNRISTAETRITQNADNITLEAQRRSDADGNLSARINVNATNISAKVDNERINSSFGWHLQADKFELKSNNNTVFLCNSSGITINGSGTFTGHIEASSGSFKGSITASTISGSTISGGTISGTTISGGTITGETISGSDISGGTITGSNISGGTITGSTLKGNLSMASGAQFSNLYANLATVTQSLTVQGLFYFGGASVTKETSSSFYGPSFSPTMKYSNDLGGYVPVFTSGLSWSQRYAATNLTKRFLMA